MERFGLTKLVKPVQQSNLRYRTRGQGGKGYRHMKVLLIEDNKDIADMVRLCLESERPVRIYPISTQF